MLNTCQSFYLKEFGRINRGEALHHKEKCYMHFYGTVLSIFPPLIFPLREALWPCETVKSSTQSIFLCLVTWIQCLLKSVMEVFFTLFLQECSAVLCCDCKETPWTSQLLPANLLSATLWLSNKFANNVQKETAGNRCCRKVVFFVCKHYLPVSVIKGECLCL